MELGRASFHVVQPPVYSPMIFVHSVSPQVVKRLYKDWDLPMHADLQKSLEKWKREQDQYKSTHKYGNPTLDELGLTQEEVNERYKTYIQVRTHSLSLAPLSLPPSKLHPKYCSLSRQGPDVSPLFLVDDCPCHRR